MEVFLEERYLQAIHILDISQYFIQSIHIWKFPKS